MPHQPPEPGDIVTVHPTWKNAVVWSSGDYADPDDVEVGLLTHEDPALVLKTAEINHAELIRISFHGGVGWISGKRIRECNVPAHRNRM